MHAERCPVCLGYGKVRNSGEHTFGPVATSLMPKAVCHGCDGKGWVEVNDGQDSTSVLKQEVVLVTNPEKSIGEEKNLPPP